jgi:tRNA dimethylallyltransferase
VFSTKINIWSKVWDYFFDMSPSPTITKDTDAVAAAVHKPMVIVIAGPTGSGKSDVAARICADRNGIIVSADSVQAYRGVQIGANKPDAQELARTPHVLIDVADHDHEYNAAAWTRDAIFVIRELLGRVENDQVAENGDDLAIVDNEHRRLILDSINRAKSRRTSLNFEGLSETTSFQPVVVGGTMMYIQWLIHGRPDALRPSQEAQQVAEECIENFQEKNDWEGAKEFVSSHGEKFAQQVQNKLYPNDWYRIRRVLEVALTVKDNDDERVAERLYSGIREGGLKQMDCYDVRCFFLCPDDRMSHTKVVDRRCEQMVCNGLLTETSNLLMSGHLPMMASKAIGYQQILEYLLREDPKYADEEQFYQYLEKFTAATRQYCKRQMQWFRRDKEFVFLPVPLSMTKDERIQKVADELTRLVSLTRDEYDKERTSDDSPGNLARKKNEAQGKGMKFYQLKLEILKPKSEEHVRALAEADECTQRIQAKKPRISEIHHKVAKID